MWWSPWCAGFMLILPMLVLDEHYKKTFDVICITCIGQHYYVSFCNLLIYTLLFTSTNSLIITSHFSNGNKLLSCKLLLWQPFFFLKKNAGWIISSNAKFTAEDQSNSREICQKSGLSKFFYHILWFICDYISCHYNFYVMVALLSSLGKNTTGDSPFI